MFVRARMPGFNAARERENHGGSLLINRGLTTQQKLNATQPMPQKAVSAGEIRGAFLASLDQFRRSRLGRNQHNRCSLTRKILPPAAHLRTTDAWWMIVEQNEVRFEAQAHLACKSGAICRNNVVVPILKKGFRTFSIRRSHV